MKHPDRATRLPEYGSKGPLSEEGGEAKKAQFLATLSHQLRTPLSVIKLYVEALQDGMYDNTDEAFARLDAKCREIEQLMDELLKEAKTK
ncbi:histidine kinase dimerization/phospho-acceptor domain-containing protein [Pseudoalteromonas xiamenensis]|uniref:histidine kinase dimerization/phospho-acceptor domain-containing protein n=1 Tax=Pseudoalteromonas xiamenensis TaxID=882626 RepID=UPI0027E4DE25|nr:histidine kinase dimerization/phospho-acceptor domain-containing protein [Pseudoalteromonas xiamenensis]WMN61972.1 hypothetical protein NI389_19415 [Pseudoalteromonas xiamenensis]